MIACHVHICFLSQEYLPSYEESQKDHSLSEYDQCPTLSILATDDKMCPVKEGKKLADLIEGSKVDIIDNCGHMMLLEEADRVLKVLKKFVTTNYPPKN